MDISIRFWDDIAGEAVTRYFDFRFFKWPNADNILEELLKATTNPPAKSISAFYGWTKYKLKNIQKKNWRTFGVARKFPSCLKWAVLDFMSSMGLSSLGFKTTGWEIEKIFKGMWRLFHDSPARRATYITTDWSDQFPLMFCQTRWWKMYQ